MKLAPNDGRDLAARSRTQSIARIPEFSGRVMARLAVLQFGVLAQQEAPADRFGESQVFMAQLFSPRAEPGAEHYTDEEYRSDPQDTPGKRVRPPSVRVSHLVT